MMLDAETCAATRHIASKESSVRVMALSLRHVATWEAFTIPLRLNNRNPFPNRNLPLPHCALVRTTTLPSRGHHETPLENSRALPYHNIPSYLPPGARCLFSRADHSWRLVVSPGTAFRRKVSHKKKISVFWHLDLDPLFLNFLVWHSTRFNVCLYSKFFDILF